MTQSERIQCGVLALLVLLHVAAGVYVSYYAIIWQDENWYFGSSLYILNGLVPYQDFFTYHNPLVHYINAIPQWMFGPSFLAGRLFSVGLSGLTLVCIITTARRLFGMNAAIVASLCFMLNLYYLQFITASVTYHSMAVLLVAAFMTTYFSQLRHSYKTVLCWFIIGALIAVRYPLVDFILPIYFLAFCYFVYKAKQNRTKTLVYMLVGLLPLLVMYLYLFVVNGDAFFFDTVTFNASVGHGDNLKLIEVLMHDPLFFLKRHYRSFLHLLANNGIALVLFAFVFTYVMYHYIRSRRAVADWRMPKEFFIMASAFVIVTELVLLAPNSVQTIWHFVPTPFLAVFLGIGLVIVWQRMQRMASRIGLLLAVVMLSAYYIPQQQFVLSASWKTSDQYALRAVKQYLGDTVPMGEQIFTFIPIYALEAGHRVSLDMLHEVIQIIPEMTTAECKKYGLVNHAMLVEELVAARPGALVLKHPGRMEDTRHAGTVLNVSRASMKAAIEKNYYPAEQFPLSGTQGKMVVYLRKGA
jgi:4-amino-4-deoxy-L-arabinose transferase-like glycosyltransferase